MKIALLIVIIISGFVSGFAQKAEKWRVLAPANEEFTVEVPLELNYSDDKSEDAFLDDKSRDTSRGYGNRLEDTYFFVFSEGRSETLSAIKSGLDFIRKFDEKGNAVSFGRLEGRKFAFADDEGFYHTAVFMKTKARAYLFHAVSENRSSSAADRFIGSLKIEEKELSQLKAPTQKTVPALPEDDEKEIEPANAPINGVQSGDGRDTGQITGYGTGLGRVSRASPSTVSVGGGPAPSVVPDPAIRPTNNVIIRSKPRASYTDAARIYNIQGPIMLRVTFLADGTIGDVSPVSRIPFGLTNQAIAAAKTIKFEPARKEGIAYSKVMTVQYGFTIY
jgi:hypothetical protein